MSVTIIARQKDVDFWPGTALWTVCGYAFAGVGLPVTVSPNLANEKQFGDLDFPRPIDKLSKKDAANAAQTLRHFYLNQPSYRLNWLHDMTCIKYKVFKCEADDPRDLQNYIEEFATFLEKSGGYRCV